MKDPELPGCPECPVLGGQGERTRILLDFRSLGLVGAPHRYPSTLRHYEEWEERDGCLDPDLCLVQINSGLMYIWALHVADPDLISGIAYGLLSMPGMTPVDRARDKSWAPPDVAPKTKTK